MGHVVNPISWRLSHIRVWKNSFLSYDLINYSSSNVITQNTVKILEVLCKKRIIRSSLFFFGGVRYLTLGAQSLLLFNFKSRLYYSFVISAPFLNIVKKKIFPIRTWRKTDSYKFLKFTLKKRPYLNRRFYTKLFKRAFVVLNSFYRPFRRHVQRKIKFLKIGRLRYINYYKFAKYSFRFALQFFIFFKKLKSQNNNSILRFKNFGESYLINLYIQSWLKKNPKLSYCQNFKKSLNVSIKHITSPFLPYVIRKFLSYRNSRKTYRYKNFLVNSSGTSVTNSLWIQFALKYKLWRLFFELPIIFQFKLFLIKFLTKYFSPTLFPALFFFLGRGVSFVNAPLMRDFLLIKIKQKFKVAQLYKASGGYLIKLLRLGIIRGFKIFLAGRFSRKDRATFTWRKIGQLPLNDSCARIDYAAGKLAVRYSTCAVKVWVYF